MSDNQTSEFPGMEGSVPLPIRLEAETIIKEAAALSERKRQLEDRKASLQQTLHDKGIPYVVVIIDNYRFMLRAMEKTVKLKIENLGEVKAPGYQAPVK